MVLTLIEFTCFWLMHLTGFNWFPGSAWEPMKVGSADLQKPTQKLHELLAQKNYRVNSLVTHPTIIIQSILMDLCYKSGELHSQAVE